MVTKWMLWLAIWLALSGCAALPADPAQPPGDDPVVRIYVVAHDGHTGIAVPRSDIAPEVWPESRDFPHADYLEVGWGNRDYYYGRDQGLSGTLRAVLPSPSVVHVVGFRGSPASYFRANEIIELAVPLDAYQRLLRYISDAFHRAGAPSAANLGPGLYADSRFYPGEEQFHLFRTCNVWTARALRSAGLPIRDAITMDGLMSQAREVGSTVNRPRN
jgi:uncharacterized protein (TIGR02117 family)